MSVPLLRPGQTDPAVPKLKKALVRSLLERNHDKAARVVNPASRTYGPRAVHGVKIFQRDKKLSPDGVVGERTWRALGIKDKVVDTRPVLHGVPWEPGVIGIDGNWVDKPLGEQLLAQRKAGKWGGRVNSGYRPPWYQKRLWDAAVKKYGSEAAAAKWVARPGKSRHGKKGGQGAVDVSLGGQLDASTDRLYRPMSWEEWHVQLTASREMPEEEPTEVDPGDLEVPEAELAERGLTVEDIDASIAKLLEYLDRRNDELEEAEKESIDMGYDPEQELAPTREGATG
jgi:D-alanyl-D-alanine carboxypeptidase/Putative peptidoglycan binding domain